LLDAAAISDGWVPRFIVIEYTGDRPPRNPRAFVSPPADLIDRVAELAEAALVAERGHTVKTVEVSSDAKAVLDAFDREADGHINGNLQDASREVWNRAHLKALRLAALLAVGRDCRNPVVSGGDATWACDLVRRFTTRIFERFASGDVGTGDTRREADVRRAVNAWPGLSLDTKRSYGVSEKLLRSHLMPMCYLRRRLRPLAAFRQDRRGESAALDSTVRNMVEAKELLQVSAADAKCQLDIDSPLIGKGVNFPTA
jgi:hypothetical protein